MDLLERVVSPAVFGHISQQRGHQIVLGCKPRIVQDQCTGASRGFVASLAEDAYGAGRRRRILRELKGQRLRTGGAGGVKQLPKTSGLKLTTAYAPRSQHDKIRRYAS